MRMRRTFALVILMASVLLGPSSVQAAPIALYTFDQNPPGAATPLVNLAPISGPAGFVATFTSAPAPNGFVIAPFPANGLFSGNSLIELAGVTGNVLTVLLSQPVFSITTAFATNGPGGLSFVSAVGSTSVTSTAQGGGAGFPGGILSFTSLVPFTTFTLSAGASPEFGIDNLQFDLGPPVPSEVPEPSTLVLLGIGVASAVSQRRRTKRSAAPE